MSPTYRPLLAVTMGDPCGIGPEACAKALPRPEALECCRPVLIGDVDPMRDALRAAGREDIRLRVISALEGANFEPGTVNLMAEGAVREGDYQIGRVCAAAGDAAYRYVAKAVDLALQGEVDGTVTAPLCKESLRLAGHGYAGHTEIYAALTGCERYAMMLAHGEFRVMHVSTHVPLIEAINRVTKERVLDVIRLADRACRAIGIGRPRVAVAGLNPHAGEHGLFGREEIDEILPAVEAARAEGLLASGPLPPDTVFALLKGRKYDVCVCMYHDQGHIPVKLLGFEFDPESGAPSAVSGVNITVGLPVIRVSVDHGTAFDIAGKGIASDASLLGALSYAARMCLGKRGQTPT